MVYWTAHRPACPIVCADIQSEKTACWVQSCTSSVYATKIASLPPDVLRCKMFIMQQICGVHSKMAAAA